MIKTDDPTVWRTPNLLCPACQKRRPHQAHEWHGYHPHSRDGYDGNRWSDPMLDPLKPLALRGRPDPEENPLPPGSHDVDELGESKRNGVNPWLK